VLCAAPDRKRRRSPGRIALISQFEVGKHDLPGTQAWTKSRFRRSGGLISEIRPDPAIEQLYREDLASSPARCCPANQCPPWTNFRGPQSRGAPRFPFYSILKRGTTDFGWPVDNSAAP